MKAAVNQEKFGQIIDERQNRSAACGGTRTFTAPPRLIHTGGRGRRMSQFHVPAESPVSHPSSAPLRGCHGNSRELSQQLALASKKGDKVLNHKRAPHICPLAFVLLQLWEVSRRVNEPSRSRRETAPWFQRRASAVSPSRR